MYTIVKPNGPSLDYGYGELTLAEQQAAWDNTYNGLADRWAKKQITDEQFKAGRDIIGDRPTAQAVSEGKPFDPTQLFLTAGSSAAQLISSIFGAQSQYLLQSGRQGYLNNAYAPNYSYIAPQGGTTGISTSSGMNYLIYGGLGIVALGILIFAMRK